MNTTLTYTVAANTARRHIADAAARTHLSTPEAIDSLVETLEDEIQLLTTLRRDWAHLLREEAELNRQAAAELARQQNAAAAREAENTAIF